MKRLALAAALASGIGLMACGGGGDDRGVAIATAEGIWGGTTSHGHATALIVAESGETWGIYGGGSDAGVLYGTTTSGGGQVTGNVKDLSLVNSSVAATTFQGALSPETSMDIRIGPTVTLKATYDASYDVPVSLAQIAGSYSGSVFVTGGLVDKTVVLNIASDGTINGSGSTSACTVDGSAQPRAPSKNILNFSVTFSGASCLFGNGVTLTGVAQEGKGELVAIGVDAGANHGLMFTGKR